MIVPSFNPLSKASLSNFLRAAVDSLYSWCQSQKACCRQVTVVMRKSQLTFSFFLACLIISIAFAEDIFAKCKRPPANQ